MSDTASTPPTIADPSRPLRVLFYIGSLAAGGAERQVVTILQHLDRSRFTPELALSSRTGELLTAVPADVPIFAFQDDPGVQTRWTRLGMGRLARWRWLTSLLRQRRIDVVQDRTYRTTLDAAPATWWQRVPRISAAVADPEVQFDLYARRPRFLWRVVSRWAYHTAALVLANSAGLRHQLIATWRLSPACVHVQPNAYDFEGIDRLAAQPPSVRPDDRFRMLTVGRVDRDKGHADLLTAIELLVRDRGFDHFVWQIIGDGPELGTLQQAAQQRGLSDCIQFLGVVTNPFPYYRAADVFCLPSRTEGLPNVLIEALACGTPVIAADCPSGPREILDGGQFGDLLPVRDPAAWVTALAEHRRRPERLRAAARSGQTAVRERYAAATVIPQLENLLLRAAMARAGHSPIDDADGASDHATVDDVDAHGSKDVQD